MQPFKFVVVYDTKIISYFWPKKDKRNLPTRLSEDSDPQKSSIRVDICRNVNTQVTSFGLTASKELVVFS